MAKAEFLGFLLELPELDRQDVAIHGKLICGGLKVLTQGDDIAVVPAHIFKSNQDLFHGFPHSKHQPRFGKDISPNLFGSFQNIQRTLVNGARPYPLVKPRHGLHIVVQDVNPRAHHRFEGFPVPLKIRDQDFDAGTRTEIFDPKNRPGKVR